VNLLGDLVRSLELYEDERLSTETPSTHIVNILQSAFRDFSEDVDRSLAESMARVRPTVQEDIISVYRDQFFDHTVSWQEQREQRNRVAVSAREETAIQRLLLWAKDDRLEIDIRVDALEALSIACEYATAGVLSHFLSLLGHYAIVSAEEHPPKAPPKILLPNQPQDPRLGKLEEFHRIQQWKSFKHRLQECLAELSEARPSEVFDSISGCMNQPSGPLVEGFRACCVSLLGKIGKDYLFRPRVLPFIWQALMDYGSTWVRAEAIDATLEMFLYSDASPPANLTDIMVVQSIPPPEVEACNVNRSKRVVWEPPAAAVGQPRPASGPARQPSSCFHLVSFSPALSRRTTGATTHQ
jgi:hypothetical protein